MALSFPWPLPVGSDPADALCSNRTRIDARLCTPPEVEQYYKVWPLQSVLERDMCTSHPLQRARPCPCTPVHPHAVHAAD